MSGLYSSMLKFAPRQNAHGYQILRVYLIGLRYKITVWPFPFQKVYRVLAISVIASLDTNLFRK